MILALTCLTLRSVRGPSITQYFFGSLFEVISSIVRKTQNETLRLAIQGPSISYRSLVRQEEASLQERGFGLANKNAALDLALSVSVDSKNG
jgi:hypothetical protein